MADKLQAQRYEHKYLITEDVALSVRDFVRSFLVIDEYGATQPNLSYPVHSLYLDSDDLRLYQSTINGDKNRFKLRLRFYENRPAAPIYFEIKKRTNNTISKQRGGVKREFVREILQGAFPAPHHIVSHDPRQLVAVQNFSKYILELGAKPKAHVAYLREAWISPHDNSVRVTMDRDVRCSPEPEARFVTDMIRPASVFEGKIVLELKFTNRFPDWFKQLVRVFGLAQCGAAKYVDGVTELGAAAVTYAFALPEKPVVPVNGKSSAVAPINGSGSPPVTAQAPNAAAAQDT
ncbi:MAG TPA: polyphosphate polymerase domain-containing protein [Methylomirabilota bacterium]|nr:polyphosphate polymerase domain-containing protein [Methylomirabilota bacterium]